MDYEVSSGQTSSGISLTGESMYVFSGGVAKKTTINEGGNMHVDKDGSANDTVVNSSGSMSVAGSAYKTVLNGSGYWMPGKMNVLDGGVANSTTVNSGGSMQVDKGGTADATIVSDCGSMHVFNGGVANSTTVNSGGSMYVDENGIVNSAIVNSGGTLDIQKDGTATAIKENGGYVNVADGANVAFVTNSFEDLQLMNASATLHSGTTATSATVENIGKLHVFANGSADATTVNSGGNLYVSSGGMAGNTTVNELGNLTVNDGGVADTTTVNAGSMYVESGGTANKTTVNDLGCMFVFGTANETVVNGDDYGELYIYEGGVANRTTVNSGGNVIIDGTANSTTVQSDGYLGIAKGGKHTGTLTIAEGAVVSAYAGSILDFDISVISPENAALVNDLSCIQGTPDYTLTVDGDEADGTYSLADKAANFAGTISVVNTAGDALGMLSVGETVKIGGDDYTLNLNEGALSVSVVHDVTAPVITLTADTETVVLQTTLTATVDDGSKIEYRIGEFGLWKEYKEPIIASLNETYYFMAMDDAGNIGTNQITFGNIDTSGILLSTLWSQRGINPMGGNTTILFNEYTPLDPGVTPEAHCLTGCVNTASGQLIYYFIEKGWLDLPLTLKESDEYTSKHKATDEDGEKIVIEIKADGTTPGTLSFAEINAMLSDYQLDSAEHAAALLYAIGVVLESKYSAASTGTSWNGAFFKRAGFEGGTMGGPYYGQYYWGDMDDEMQCTISDAGFEVLIENLEAGLPVGATYPGHAFVIDGYDRESDRFHVNFGWGGNVATRWYTRDEIHELNFEAFVYDLNPEYMETFTVTDARVYGTGTMIRAFEQAAGMIGDNTVAFDPSIAGKTVELLNHITLFDEVVTVNDFNMNVLVTKSDGGERGCGFYAEHIDVFEPTDPSTVLTFHSTGGALIVSTENEFNYAFQMEDGLSGTVDANGMLIWAGKTSEGISAAAVLQALQTCRSENTEVSDDLLDPNGWSYNGSAGEDVFRLSNSSLAVGKVSLGGGDDILFLTGHSKLYGNIDAGDGNDSITVDSTSSVSGDLAGTCKLNFVLSERDDHAMFTIQSSASGLCADATVTVDMKDAEIGTYTLISGASGATDVTDLRDLAVTITGSGTPDFTLSVNGTSTSEFADLIFEDDSLKLQVKKESVKGKWTYLVYMAADNDLCYSALYDIVSMQQAKVDSQIDIYVLADRTPAGTKGSGDYETINGTYKWGADWEDTRVGKITYSPGLTVTVDWTSWGELDTGSIATLERFVDWAQAESPAENYGLIVWDHGEENTDLCWDLTTDPDWDACITVSEVAGLLKEKGNIPLVIFNNCLLGSELVATQMAGSTDVIVVSEPSSYGMSTFNFNMFFRMLTPDMTPQEMAALMVRNVELQSEYVGEPTMLTSIDVTDSRLFDALEALAEAVASANNDADKEVLIHAMLQAPQDGSSYDGTNVQQSDLGFMIRDAMADPDYAKTSEGFRKALADVSAALEAIVLEYRSVPAKRGSGIAVCNSVYTAKMLMTSGATPEAAGARVSSYLTSTYDSNPLWGGLLNDLCATYLAEIEAGRIPTAVFSDSEVVVDGRTVTVSDLGGFSGRGELFDCIKLHDERFFGFDITVADKSTGSFTITNDVGAAVTVSLLAADGTEVATGISSVSFQDLAVGTYYLRLQSETDCRVTITADADWWTGVDRFEDNDTCETATALDAGYHTGLITCGGDPDYYLIGNYDVMLYTVEVYGEEGWTVGEYFPDDEFFYEADYEDGKYTLMMDPMGCLLVEGTADLAKGVNAYSVNVIPYESEWPAEITLDDLVGTKDGVSWEPSVLMNKYYVEYSPDNFEHTMRVVTTGTAVDTLNLPSGTYQWRVTTDAGKNPDWFDGEKIVVPDDATATPSVFRSSSDASDDLFFAMPNGTWSRLYCAQHAGSVGDWSGTGEMVSAKGKGRIQDLFFGSADPGTLYLTDSDNGDALFLDDVYTGLPEEIEENTARLFRLCKIIAGAGDDIVDMTSQRFEYTGGALVISGGDGNDVIWANKGSRNSLFGDAGNDRIVGASGDDVIVGGIGDDSMHGGGGDDIFTFCENWGTDTVEQLETGSVTLWFRFGSMENWDEKTLTYSDGAGNSVTVSGVSADRVSLKFESAGSKLFATLVNMGAFVETSTKKIFNDTDKGLLAGVSI